ncbi:MAG: ATP-binding protein [Bacteroidetes bacterium]|nr:ATP-binding protein [Bacteroidota bacterium]
MKITVHNLGLLKKATFELGDLTIICGLNNTGKTYAAYALFGFLENWLRYLGTDVPTKKITQLFEDGVTRIDITQYTDMEDDILQKGCQNYTHHLSKIFASDSKYFSEAKFSLELDKNVELTLRPSFERKLRSKKSELLSFSKPKGEAILTVSLSAENDDIDLPSGMIKDAIADVINEILFDQYFPNPFIASTERTGVAIFSKELDFARNRLLEEMAQSSKDIDPWQLLFKSYNDYPWPVRTNVDFIRRITDITKQESFISKNHSHILNQFMDIVGGEYISDNNNSLYFKPSGKRLKLTMGESSSAVRSMLNIGAYLRHIAQPDDLLMIDEPELNLHPENQRKIARLIARLTKLDIRVFITTHSDYILKEFNTLIMLNQDKPYLREISDRAGYNTEEFLETERVKVYIAEQALIKTSSNNKRRSRHLSLVEAEISQDLGINARSFDQTINAMNEIQEAIVWGG